MDFGDFLFCLLIAVLAWLTIVGWRRQNRLVREWAVANSVVLLRRLPSWYRLSPFPFAAAFGKHRIQYWLVRDQSGVEQRVWLKLGDFLFGSLIDSIEEEWES
jgi:hypothetical protein